MILSASRRTDIPAFYSDWFINRIKEGYVLTRNPMNPSQLSRINLSPEVIDCIVFWTKDPLPMINKLKVLDDNGYSYYFQFTLTPYDKDIERKLRDKKDILLTFKELSQMIGKERVLWRYDPIILNETLSVEYHLNEFDMLCNNLSGYTDRCTISFVDLYSKVNRSVREGVLREIDAEESIILASGFSDIGKRYGINIYTCCEKIDYSKYGILPARCIDKEVIEKISGHSLKVKKDNNQRLYCGCMQSIDIGVYNTCKNGCIYCYANYSIQSVENNYQSHNPDSELLLGSVRAGEIAKVRKV